MNCSGQKQIEQIQSTQSVNAKSQYWNGEKKNWKLSPISKTPWKIFKLLLAGQGLASSERLSLC